ncbi:MAG: hypothetical protein Roseis3KO_41820 [Roseivirga sp.]
MLGAFSAYSQNAKADSLRQLLPKSAMDTSKVSLHLQLAEALQEDDAAEATNQVNAALTLSDQLNFPLGTARANRMMGEVLFEKREVKQALAILEKAKTQFNKLGATREEMGVLERKIQIYYNASLYEEAITALKVLLKHWQNEQDTSEITTNLNRLSICYEEMGDFQKSIDIAREGYELSLQIRDIEGAAMNLNNIGFVYRAWGESDKALATFTEARDLAQKAERPDMEAVFYQNIGIVHNRAGRSVKALEAYFTALEIFESIEDEGGISDMLHNIGLVYKMNGEYAKSMTYYRRSVAYDLKIADTLDLSISYHNIGNVMALLGNYDSAKFYLTKSYNLAKSSGQQCFNGEAGALGDLYYQLGNLDSAEHYLQEEMAAISQCGNTAHLATTQYNLGLIYRDRNQNRRAVQVFEKGLKAAIEYNQLDGQKDAALALYEWHKAAGNTTRALYYHELFQIAKDSLFNQENTRQLAWMEANYQLENVTDSLNRKQTEEASMFSQKIQRQRDQQRLIIIISVGLLLCMVFYYLYFRKQKELTYEKALAIEKSNGFNAVMTATEEERKRIAKDLHDGVVQQMGAVQLALARVIPDLPDDQAKEINDIKEMTAAAASETRELSHQMMPKVLIEMGLLPAMKEVIERTLVLQNIKVDFEDFGLQDRYPNSIEIAIYRIFQELVNNIVKHARATEVNVQLIQNGARLILIVEDNGQGMGAITDSGIGLQNIQSRLSTIDGKVDYSSGPASGTVATIVIPL